MHPWQLLCGGLVLLDLIAMAWLAREISRAPINPYEP